MRFSARALLLCVLAASTSLAGAQPVAPARDALPLPQLLSRMRAVNGGLWNAHLSSTSPHTVDGVQTMLDTEAQGLKYVLRQCNAHVCLGTYFDGERLYSVNINGTALPRSPEPEPYLRALRILGTLDFLAPGFTQNGGRIDDGGWSRFEGRRVRRIYVSDGVAVPMIVYVDPRSGLVTGASDVNGDANYQLYDYRRVGAFMLPYSIDRNGIPLERYVTRSIVPQPLDIPRGLQPVIEAQPAGMALDPQSDQPLGTCTIAGVQARCLIDSGNSALSMSVELADKLHLQPVGMMRIAGLGDYATEVVRAGPLQMGNVRFGEANYIVLSDIRRYGYDLVVGADVLASTSVTIDYARHALYFGREPSGEVTGTTVPLEFQNFVPVVNVQLGGVSASLAVDTGDESNINLSYAYYQKHPDLFAPTKTEGVGGVGGDSEELIGQIPTVRIGTLTAQNQQIGTTKSLKGTANGHLGGAFLSHYRVTLDYAHELLRLFPGQAPES